MRSFNQLLQAKSATYHHSYFSAVQKRSIGTFISVSGTHETKSPEHLSQSTHAHTVHSMELWERQTVPPTDIRPVKENWELSLSYKLFSASIPLSLLSNPWRGHQHTKAIIDTHAYIYIYTCTFTSTCIIRTIKDKPSCQKCFAGCSGFNSNILSHTQLLINLFAH